MNNDIWPRQEEDFIELGDTHWVPASDGGFINYATKESMDADGNIYNKEGELVKEAYQEEQAEGD